MRLLIAVLGIAGLLAMPGRVSAADQLSADLQRFLDWFPGEYDNHEQVWQQKLDGAEDVLEHLHHIFAPVSIVDV